MPSHPRALTLSAAASAVAAAALLLSSCSTGSTGSKASDAAAQGSSSASSSAASAPSTPASSTSTSTAPKTPVHIKLFNSDGSTYGVGIPVIAYFSKKIKSAKALQAATKATANGKPIKGAWYFEPSDSQHGYPYEAHFRPQNYWPAHSHIHVDIPAKGLSAGGNMAYNDSLTSDWHTGAAHIGVVNNYSHKLTITSDGKRYGTFPVSLGASSTPTYRGTKVIMEQVPTVCMHDTAGTYYECGIKFDSRLTYSGEYLHAAPWNVSNIESGVNSSNGCTNLLPADAEQLYHYLRVGDVVKYPNADGAQMQLGYGFGDWNVSWGEWLTGGAVATDA